MITFPNAKINLGLHVLRKRSDGFHDIETIFYPIPWYDALEAVPAAKPSLQISGEQPAGSKTDNLVWKALQLLQKDFTIPPMQWHLLKAIPAGAGLGGGSADAAFTLQMLNKSLSLGLSAEALEARAALLGSDCAFFIRNAPHMGTGKGDQLTPVHLSLDGWYLVVLFPDVAVPTAWAYRQLTPRTPIHDLSWSIKQPVSAWKKYLHNDFEEPVFAHYPVLAKIKQQLYECGATYAAMSGSGSAVFGLFDTIQDAMEIAVQFRLPAKHVFVAKLASSSKSQR